MNYHNITHDDMLNGDGLRTVLWVAGCGHHCDGCQNPETWNPDGGLPFDESAEEELFRWLDKDYCSGLTFSGGDPLHPANRKEIERLCRKFREKYGEEKTIWLYTGYQFTSILQWFDVSLLDVVIDGEYVEEERDVMLQWCGSRNQLIWRRNGDRWTREIPQHIETINPKEVCGCEND